LVGRTKKHTHKSKGVKEGGGGGGEVNLSKNMCFLIKKITKLFFHASQACDIKDDLHALG